MLWLASGCAARHSLLRGSITPFICKVHEIGDTDGRAFIVMEYVEGDTLHTHARRALLPVRQVLDIAHELAQALDAAHRRGIVHRDLKPANVMLTPQGHVKVMDFGLAKQVTARPSPSHDGTSHEPDTQTLDGVASTDARVALTDAGTRIGTPAYMSPEQILGAALDPRSDLFSLGVILHELATGRHPFLRDDPSDTMAAILRDPPTPGSRDLDEPAGFGAVIHRLLSKACAERHQTTAALLDDLEALKTNAWSPSRTTTTAPAPPAERTPFVGRDTESVELTRLLDQMLTGQGGLVLLGGEPGVGKTRLARELMATARSRGCLSLTGHCYEMEGAAPFMPFVEIVEQSVRMLPQAVRVAMGDLAPEIAAMVPSLRRTYSDIPPIGEVPADQQRRLIFGAFLDYMRRATQKSPCVFLLDDLHWADEATLQLLQHLAPQLATMRVLIVGTYRDVELDVTRPFAKTLESLLRQRLATRIALRRLSESAVHELLATMSGSAPPSGLTTALFRETEGNPFFVEEVYQHLSEEGKLFDATGAWKADLRVDTIEVPEGVRLVIGRRLDRLGEQARKVLTAGAVIGRTFPLDLLQAVADLSDDAVLDALEEAERAQLVAADASQRTVRYGFVHELIRTTLVTDLSLPRRQRLHLKVADALERLRAASLESHASVLAHHLYQAGAAADSRRTATFLRMAGRRALAAGAFEETLATFDQMLGLELPEDDALLGEASEHRGEAFAGLLRYDDAVVAFDGAMTTAIARHDDAGIERAAMGASNSLTWLARPGESQVPLRRGLEALANGAARERALLLAQFAWSGLTPAYLDEAWQSIDEARALAARVGDPHVDTRVLTSLAFSHRLCGEYEAASAAGRSALPAVRAGSAWGAANLLLNLVLIEQYRGNFSACDALLPELEAAAKRGGHHGALFLHERVQHAIELARTGDIRTYLEHSLVALRGPHLRYVARSYVAAATLYLGAVEEALEHVATVAAEQPTEHWYAGMPEGNRFAATALGGRADAEGLIPALLPWLPVAGRRNVEGAYFALETFVTGLAVMGDRERLAGLYPLTLASVQNGRVYTTVTVGPSSSQLVAALAADADGLHDQAREHFEIALRQAHEVPVRILQPTVLYWYGRALSAAEDAADRARGRAMVEAALTDFRALEMVLHANLAEQFLRQGR